MILHAVVRSPYAVVLLPAPALEPPARRFAAFRARHGARGLLGQGVLDEFGTFSSPVFLAPRAALGEVYQFGLALAVERDPEMPLDAGWPTLCLGLDASAPMPGGRWETELRAALVAARPGSESGESDLPLASSATRSGDYVLERWRSGTTSVVATDAPLLPRQLGRLCDEVDGDLVLAFSTANRLIAAAEAGGPIELEVAGEALLDSLAKAAATL